MDDVKNYPFRVVIMRKVSEEEQVNIEVFQPTQLLAEASTNAFLELLGRHRDAHNEKVLTVMRTKLDQLDQQIESKGRQIREAETTLDELETKIRAIRKKHPQVAEQPRA